MTAGTIGLAAAPTVMHWQLKEAEAEVATASQALAATERHPAPAWSLGEMHPRPPKHQGAT